MVEKNKYYTLSYNLDKKLSFSDWNYDYYPAKDWKDAKVGVFTNPEIVEKWTNEKGNKCAYITGTMVETEPFDFSDPASSDIHDIIVLGDAILIKFKSNDKYYGDQNYYTKLKNGELVKVKASLYRRLPGNYDKRCQLLKDLVGHLKLEYGAISYQHFKEVCINVFAEKTLDSAQEVVLIDDFLFHIFYPGAYRDFCSDFYVKKNGKIVDAPYGSILLESNNVSKKILSLHNIEEEMAKYGISAGEDSGDVVEGVTKKERKLLTTHKLASGAVIVQLKAKTFRYELLENKRLMSKVDKGIGKWLYRLSEYNEYYTWID